MTSRKKFEPNDNQVEIARIQKPKIISRSMANFQYCRKCNGESPQNCINSANIQSKKLSNFSCIYFEIKTALRTLFVT